MKNDGGFIFRTLNIKDNKFKDFQINEVFAAIQSNIEKFDMSGRHSAAVNLKNFNKLVDLILISRSLNGCTVIFT